MVYIRKSIPAATIVALLAGTAFLAQAQPKSETKSEPKAAGSVKPFKPVLTVHHLMEGQGKLMGDLKLAVLDEEWESAEALSWVLAELGNVNHYQKDDPQYRRFADTMSKRCVEMGKVTKKRDAAAAKAAFSNVGRSCKACHDQFRKEEEE